MLRILVPVSMAIIAVVFIEKGASVCNKCLKGTKDDACVNNTFNIGNYTEDTSLCQKVKDDSDMVAGLCKTFPDGYKLLCEGSKEGNATKPVCEGSCSAAVPTGLNNLTPVLLVVCILLVIVQ